MSIEYEKLDDAPRLLMEAKLKPLQGERFQPTGFADLGPARYTLPDGTEMLLVESAQSVANRMELACWDEEHDDLIPSLDNLPYIRVKDKNSNVLTNSILEAHRINSPYILKGKDKKVFDAIKKKAAAMEIGPVRIRDLAQVIFKFDTNAVLHGVFLADSELAGGRLRMPRALSGFVEARNINAADSGGVKNDNVLPSPKKLGLSADDGYGHVPFHRTEFTAEEINAYFNLDLALLRGYGLGDDPTKLLVSLALYKVRRFLSSGLRLRTACDLQVDGELKVTVPDGFGIPEEQALLDECKRLIGVCKPQFAGITEVKWEPVAKRAKKSAGSEGAGV